MLVRRVHEVNEWHSGPGPVASRVQQFGIAGQLVAEGKGLDQVSRAEDVGCVQRNLPGLGTAGHTVLEPPMHDPQEPQPLFDHREVACVNAGLE